MKIFFYSRQSVYCKRECVYYTCPRRCLERLQELPALEEMTVLSETLDYLKPSTVYPMSGDLIFLFAATWHELEELIAMGDWFEQLKVILITDITCSPNEQIRFHQLKPRFITSLDSFNIQGVGEVVRRMKNRIAA